MEFCRHHSALRRGAAPQKGGEKRGGLAYDRQMTVASGATTENLFACLDHQGAITRKKQRGGEE